MPIDVNFVHHCFDLIKLNPMSSLDTIISDIAQIALKIHHNSNMSSRYIVSLVAIPAAGKTTLAKFLCEAINNECNKLLSSTSSSDGPLIALLPMDGFHLTRHSLTHRQSRPQNTFSHTNASSTQLESFTYITPPSQLSRNFDFELLHPIDNDTQRNEESGVDDQLYAISTTNPTHQMGFNYQSWPGKEIAFAKRGAPFTFDPFLLAYALSNIKYHNPAHQIWPGWDHAKKDPSYNELISIPPSATVIIIEGLYLLLDVEPWKSLLCGSTYQSILYSSPIDVDDDVKGLDPNLSEKPISSTLIDMGIVLDCDESITLARGSIRNYQAGITSTLEESVQRWQHNDIPNGQFLMAHIVHNKVKYRLSQEDVQGIIKL